MAKSTFWKCGSIPLICSKYNMVALKTLSKDANYHELAKTQIFHCTHDNQGDFS